MKNPRHLKLTVAVDTTSNKQKGSTSNKKAKRAAPEWYPVLSTRMSPCALLRFINSGVSDKQLSDIRDMGFGGLLCLKTDMIPGQLAYWLVSDFDPFTSALSSIQLPIRDEDIHLATGIPLGEVTIMQATKYEHTDEYMALVNEWKAQYGGVEKIKFTDILNKMVEQREGGDDFKRNFIVYIVSAFLMGVKGSFPSIRILKCLGDVSVIPSLKWCDFTRNHLRDSVRRWRVDNERAAKGGSAKVFKGPIMVLIFIYLDRMVFKTRKVDRVFPTLCSWTKRAISLRISEEKREARRFGAGFVEQRLVKHPGCYGDGYVDSQTRIGTDVKVDQDIEATTSHGVSNGSKRGVSDDNKLRVTSCIENMANTGKALAHAFEKFADSINGAKIIMPNSVVVGQLSEMAESLLGGFRLTPPSKYEEDSNPNGECDQGETEIDPNDMCKDDLVDVKCASEVHSVHGGQCQTDMTGSGADAIGCGVRVTNMTGGTDDGDDPCWNDPTFVDAVCALSSAFNKVPADEPLKKKRRVALDYPTFNLFESQDRSVSDSPDTPEAPEAPNNPTDIAVSPTPAPTNTRPVMDAITVQNEVKPRIKRDTRDTVVSNVFRSPFVQRNISMLNDLNQAERDVSDLVFKDGLDDSEVLVRSKYFQLRRCDLKSLIVDTKISSNVINFWAHILNIKEDLKAASSPLRLYAFVTNNGITCQDGTDYEKVKLMFFPLTSSQPHLICVNFMTRKIEVLHPMRHMTVNFVTSVQDVRRFIQREMVAKSSRFKEVQFFKCEEYVPKTRVMDNVDDGIYLMYYMETYAGGRLALKGQLINSRPEAAVDKILFKQKLKYCFAIISCNENELSKQVLLAARRLNIKSGKQALEQEVKYSDTQLLDLVFLQSKEDAASQEVVVDTIYGQITKMGISSLKPRKWVADMVIDLFGIYSTLLSPELLYIPTIARNLIPKKDKTLGRNYIKTSYMPADGTCVKAMLIPIIEKDHWFLCVCDMEMKQNYILNSLRTKDIQADVELATKVVRNVVEILCRSNGYKHFEGVTLADFTFVPVPQQPNVYDCGVYVLKWLEAGRDRSLWEDKGYYKAMAAYRKTVALSLLRWQENKRKIF